MSQNSLNMFTIDYSKWRCGFMGPHRIGNGNTRLLNIEGFQCCLGQIEEQLGVSKYELLNMCNPANTRVINFLFNGKNNTGIATEAMYINDDESSTPAMKMHDLILLFEKNKMILKFINVPTEVMNEYLQHMANFNAPKQSEKLSRTRSY